MTGKNCLDVLSNGKDFFEFSSKKVETKDTHGTGCTLSAAVAALVAQKNNVPLSVKIAKRFVTRALSKNVILNVGKGSGPLNIF